MKNLILFLIVCLSCSKKELQESMPPIILEKHDYACIHNIQYQGLVDVVFIKYLEDVLNVTEDSIIKYTQKETYEKLVFLYLPDTAFFVNYKKVTTYSKIISKEVKPIIIK